jgi:3',5'-cyclic AMP phosphodiesterase CpdA
MKRRSFLKHIPLTAVTVGLGTTGSGLLASPSGGKKVPVLTVAHITDVHITGEGSAAGKFSKCLEEIKRHKPDFFLNGGDSVMDVSYNNVKREQVYSLWKVWDECTGVIKDHEVFSCIGNHDSWWAAPSKDDEMYGKGYAVKRLGIPDRYYSFSRKGWHFIILDGNNDNISLDQQQYDWLASDLEKLPAGTPTLLMSHYPILGVTPLWEGGGHADCKKLKSLFYKHRDKVKVCLSGHIHLQDRNWYNGVAYFCNGSISGFWWGKGDEHSAAPYYYEETPPGYAILRLYGDGAVENEYHTPECLVE